MNEFVLYDDGVHKVVMFCFDYEEYTNSYLSVNQYAIFHKDWSIIIDPGSSEIFDDLYEAILKYTPSNKIKYIYLSHQDPDVASSILGWGINTPAKIITSKVWTRFLSHYGLLDNSKIIGLDDNGMKINYDGGYLEFVPAHFMHSPGNFSLYDSKSKILFSSDIGSSIKDFENKSIDNIDFDEHISLMEDFHKRFMAGNKFCKKWVEKVSKLDIVSIYPQHGLAIQNENIKKFYKWFKSLKCGSDIIEEIYD